jgi:hypothetical protein
MALVDAVGTRLSPERAWAVAGAISFPALYLALGLPNTQLVAVAVVIAGVAVVTGAILAASGRGFPIHESALTWAVAYTAGVLVYLMGSRASWPQPDIEVIVTPDGRGGLNGEQEVVLLFLSIGITLLLGAGLDESHRVAPGKRLKAAASAAAAWAVALLPLPVLIVYGVYATSMLGNAIPFWREVPAHTLGLICSGAMAGFIVSAIGEGVMRHVRT